MALSLRKGLVLALLLASAGCSTPESVVKSRASEALACRDLEVTCHGGKVFHLAEQFTCEARGCGKEAKYHCETPLQNIGPFERRRAATCVTQEAYDAWLRSPPSP